MDLGFYQDSFYCWRSLRLVLLLCNLLAKSIYIIYHLIMICKSILEKITTDMFSGFIDSNEYFAQTRDIFTARLQSYILETHK